MTKPYRRWLPRKQSPAPPLLTSLDAYARWAEAYPPQAHNALMRAEEQAVRALLPALDGQIVLDLACGTGRWGLIALESGAARVIGLDNSPAMLAHCTLPERAVASLDALPLPANSIDVVICGLALGHVPELDTPLAEIARVLKPGGAAVISDFHPYLALAGAQRTFTGSDGQTYAVEHTVHLISAWVRAANACGLHLAALEEPALLADDAAKAPNAGVPVTLVLRFEVKEKLQI